MKPLAGMAAAVTLTLCASAAHAFDRAPRVPGGGFPAVNRPMAMPGHPMLQDRSGVIGRPGALLAARRGALVGAYAGWPLWYGPTTTQSPTRVIVNVNVGTSGPARLPTAADLPVKPGYVTAAPEQPTFIVMTAPQAQSLQPAPRPAPGAITVETAGTARIVEIGDGFIGESAANPRIISLR